MRDVLKRIAALLLIPVLLTALLSCVKSIPDRSLDDAVRADTESVGTVDETAPEISADREHSVPEAEPEPSSETEEQTEAAIPEDGAYTSREDVALYIHTYGRLPSNFITKAEAQSLGWSGGGLEKYAPGKCIGGDRFGNYEGILPKANGRVYHECDIDTLGKNSRGAKRIVYSTDGLIYYTEDHYESFERLY